MNKYCPGCLKTRRFKDLGDFWECPRCRKRLWKRPPPRKRVFFREKGP
jgi:hypothetical protein